MSVANVRDAWRSKRLIYRAIEPKDDALFYQLQSDSELFAQCAPFPLRPQSKAQSAKIREMVEKGLLGVVVCLPAPAIASGDAATAEGSASNPIPIGIFNIRIEEMWPHHRRAELGLMLLRAYQGQGYGTETIEWGLDWAFRFGNLHRVSLACFGHNQGAKKLYERLGFVLEGTLREAIWIDGRYYPEYVMSILEHEWRERRDQKEAVVGAQRPTD